MFTSLDVAAYIAQECDKRGFTYNNTKLQKLLYIVYGVMLAWKGERLCDEYPRAWPYGPVFPKVFKYIERGGDIAGWESPVGRSPNGENVRYIVQGALDNFGSRKAGTLSAWSHTKGSPWYRVTVEEGAGWNSFIPDEYIRDYFRKHVISLRSGETGEVAHA